jgi:peptidylprolyl isomerase
VGNAVSDSNGKSGNLRHYDSAAIMADKLSGIEEEDLVVGCGAEAGKGSTVTVHFICTLSRGDVVGNSYETGGPATFRIGSRKVIAGLEKGIVGMRVGGKRRLRVSPHLAYRDVGAPPEIPPNALLIFEVELLQVTDNPTS